MRKIFCVSFTLLIVVALFGQDKPAGLQVHDKAPAFTAKDQSGNIISLQDQLKKGPVVLVFYRGYWCPYCNKQLKKLEDSLSLITGKGARLVAITPEKPESIGKTVGKTKASYSILHDEGLRIMKSYQVAFAVDPATIEQYKKYGINFTEANGNNGANLPVPAVYIINQQGEISYRFFDANYANRASVAAILAQL